MIIQRINRTNPEKAFIVVRNDTSSAFTKGAPITFKFDATRDGLDVEDCKTGAAAKNHLLAGVADSAIAAAAYGLCQCYGVRTDAVILKCGTATNKNAAIGDAMVLDTANNGFSGVAAGAVTAYFAGVAMGETMASSASTATTTATVFLRLM
jgi:hypothetical protein